MTSFMFALIAVLFVAIIYLPTLNRVQGRRIRRPATFRFLRRLWLEECGTLNFGALATDFPAELTAIQNVYTGMKKLITDAKAGGATGISQDIADAEALIAPLESAVAGGEKLAGDL